MQLGLGSYASFTSNLVSECYAHGWRCRNAPCCECRGVQAGGLHAAIDVEWINTMYGSGLQLPVILCLMPTLIR